VDQPLDIIDGLTRENEIRTADAFAPGAEEFSELLVMHRGAQSTRSPAAVKREMPIK